MAQNSGPVQTMNSTEGAPSQQQQNPTGTTEESEAFGQICNLELCVSDCVGLQMGECEETGDSENGVGRLRQFSSQLDGLQVFHHYLS
jgi:hypothetical protein